jgi:hypothetical protein
MSEPRHKAPTDGNTPWDIPTKWFVAMLVWSFLVVAMIVGAVIETSGK